MTSTTAAAPFIRFGMLEFNPQGFQGTRKTRDRILPSVGVKHRTADRTTKLEERHRRLLLLVTLTGTDSHAEHRLHCTNAVVVSTLLARPERNARNNVGLFPLRHITLLLFRLNFASTFPFRVFHAALKVRVKATILLRSIHLAPRGRKKRRYVPVTSRPLASPRWLRHRWLLFVNHGVYFLPHGINSSIQLLARESMKLAGISNTTL